jgi:hypothetical protein
MRMQLNRAALSIPRDRLAEELAKRIELKKEVLREREKTLGKDRVFIHSYMENIGWPGLLNFDTNQCYTDSETQYEIDLRVRIFWLDNSIDDGVSGLDLNCTVGMYFDMTLFGLDITHTPQGVPLFGPHPLAETPSLAVFRPHDFRTTGAMPDLLRQHQGLRALGKASRPELHVGFPMFHRGPLDIFMQMRTYERFVEDTMERPAFLHQALRYLVEERARWNRERAAYLGEAPATTTFIADDWTYVPFITPDMFREFILPAYRRCQELDGTVTGFHTCGNFVPLVDDLLRDFPAIRALDVGGWNDLGALHARVPKNIDFTIGLINTFVLTGSEAEHRTHLELIRRIARERKVTVCVQAIVRLHDTYEEDLGRMNRFIELARKVLA